MVETLTESQSLFPAQRQPDRREDDIPVPYDRRRGPRRSGDIFRQHLALREQCANVEKLDGEALEEVQHDVQRWIEANGIIDNPDYEQYDPAADDHKLMHLTDYLENIHGDAVSPIEIEATRVFLRSTFSMYDASKRLSPEYRDDADGSFAFIVPSRLSRQRPDLGEEVELGIPALRYVPNKLRGPMMVGLPPLVIDRYRPGADGRRGYMILAPVYDDMRDAMSRANYLRTAQAHVNASVNFAYGRLGAKVIALGAILPAVTNHGRKITNSDVVVTTGHAGTTVLAADILDDATNERLLAPDSRQRVGVLGLGIGRAIAAEIARRHPDSIIRAYDPNRQYVDKAVRENPNIRGCDGGVSVIKESDVIVSAVSGKIPKHILQQHGRGKLFIDDSQPASIDEETLYGAGGRLLWVIGRGGEVVRENYEYKGIFADTRHDIFGCEAEAVVLSKYYANMLERGMPPGAAQRILGQLAVKGPVTEKHVRAMKLLFTKFSIKPAPFQAAGTFVPRGQL